MEQTQKKELPIEQMEEISGGQDPLIDGRQECPKCHQMIKIANYNRHVMLCNSNNSTSRRA